MENSVKILLAEDDANLGFIVKDNLSDKGYDVTHCANGVEAERAIFKEKFCNMMRIFRGKIEHKFFHRRIIKHLSFPWHISTRLYPIEHKRWLI